MKCNYEVLGPTSLVDMEFGFMVHKLCAIACSNIADNIPMMGVVDLAVMVPSDLLDSSCSTPFILPSGRRSGSFSPSIRQISE